MCLYPEFFGPDNFPIDLCLEVNSQELVGFAENGEQNEAEGRPCTATGNEKECRRCFVCADGGITFDCSNIVENATATCADIGIPMPTEWNDIFFDADKVTYPELDGSA